MSCNNETSNMDAGRTSKEMDEMGNKTHKNKKDMSARELAMLQSAMDDALAAAIADVSRFFDLYPIDPSVRITDNKRTLGSAKVANQARLFREKRGANGVERWSWDPLFKISISTNACETPQDLRDTLYHEIIHCVPGCFNHGKRFKAVAAKVNSEFGTNISRLKESVPAQGTRERAQSDAEMRRFLSGRIGESFRRGRKTYIFEGFNGNPKNCCDLVDEQGRQYKGPLAAVAIPMMEQSDKNG